MVQLIVVTVDDRGTTWHDEATICSLKDAEYQLLKANKLPLEDIYPSQQIRLSDLTTALTTVEADEEE